MMFCNIENTQTFTSAPLSEYTTFNLGGPCKLLIECTTIKSLHETIKSLHNTNTAFILIGGGSNIVVSDQGIDSIVIRYASAEPQIKRVENDLIISGSTYLDHAALHSVDEALAGLVFTSGIPGTVGGAVVGNAGAWGKQVGDIVKEASIINSKGETHVVGPDYFQFSYRHSKLKDTRDIVADVTFALLPGDPAALALERADILKQRALKHPNLTTHPCAGSFFRNIEPTSKAEKRQATGWFLEHVGGKELRSGGAYIYDKHANIIVKGEHCKAVDVYQLHLKMINLIKEKFNINISREVRFLGKIESVTESNPCGFW